MSWGIIVAQYSTAFRIDPKETEIEVGDVTRVMDGVLAIKNKNGQVVKRLVGFEYHTMYIHPTIVRYVHWNCV